MVSLTRVSAFIIQYLGNFILVCCRQFNGKQHVVNNIIKWLFECMITQIKLIKNFDFFPIYKHMIQIVKTSHESKESSVAGEETSRLS